MSSPRRHGVTEAPASLDGRRFAFSTKTTTRRRTWNCAHPSVAPCLRGELRAVPAVGLGSRPMPASALPDLADMTRDELTKFLVDAGQPRFRGDQVFRWIW